MLIRFNPYLTHVIGHVPAVNSKPIQIITRQLKSRLGMHTVQVMNSQPDLAQPVKEEQPVKRDIFL